MALRKNEAGALSKDDFEKSFDDAPPLTEVKYEKFNLKQT